MDQASHRRRPGIAVHRAELLKVERGTWNPIPITSPARTLVDLAHELADPDDIAWALRELQYRRLYEPTALELSLTRRPHRVLSGLLDALPAVDSRLEIAFMSRVVRRHGLPEPACQVKVEGFRTDFLWASQRVIAETDGRAHDHPSMRTADALRDAILAAAGYCVLRFRWAAVHRHHARTARRIRTALMNQAPPACPRSSAGGGR